VQTQKEKREEEKRGQKRRGRSEGKRIINQ
jgi:hypothetical protein